MIDAAWMDHPVPVVRALVEDSMDRILLLKRADTKYGHGGWCLPGGKIDYGETAENALAREIREETSLELLTAEFFLFQNSLPLTPGGMHCINLYFRCRVLGNIELNNESSEYAWISSTELNCHNIIFGNDEAIQRHFDHNS